jgi:hypothetical protein
MVAHKIDPQGIADKYPNIPEHITYAIVLYVSVGQHPGDALADLLGNDLFGFYCRADEETLAALPDMLKLLHRIGPPSSFGSPAKVDSWIQQRGLFGVVEVK